LWDRASITEGISLLDRALARRTLGPYQLQAAIAAVHSQAMSSDDTDWPQIVALYTELAVRTPSPVISLNLAVAVAMASGPAEGLRLIDSITGLDRFHLWHSARADLLRRLERFPEAREAYTLALPWPPRNPTAASSPAASPNSQHSDDEA
jgi:RNA polymerase sigma-70 factor (ECF subfamily)